MELGHIIRKRRKEKGLTQDQLSARVGISKPYLSNIETGRAKNPPTDRILVALEGELGFESNALLRLGHLVRTPSDIARELDEQQAELVHLRRVVQEFADANPGQSAGESLPRLPVGRAVPVINSVAAGYPAHFTDLDYPVGVSEEYVHCPGLTDEQAFATRVVGDSMEPVYHEGDLVVFSPNTQPRPGDDCFVRFADDAGTTFKRFYQDTPEEIRLQPLNNAYPAQIHSGDSITGLWPALFRVEQLRR
jgi:repressor LexA